MRLETATVDRYGMLSGCDPDCSNDMSIVAGPNESGKTLYLEGVLQLLDPDVTEHMDPDPRISESPNGRVVVSHDNDRHTMGENTRLSDISPIDPIDLTTLFVIRDSDLRLPEGPDYYTRLVEHFGDIHTTEIESLREALVDRGRLTEKTLKLADREYSTKSVRNEAQHLKGDIETYLETAHESGVDDLVRERVRISQRLRGVEEDLAVQKTAKERVEFEDASTEFKRFRAATERLAELSIFDRQTLETLTEHEREIEQANSRISRLEDSIQATHDEITDLRDKREKLTDQLITLRHRESGIESVEIALESLRTRRENVDSRNVVVDTRLRRGLIVGGVIGGGASVGGGALAGETTGLIAVSIGALLLGVALVMWITLRRHRTQQARIKACEREVLQTAHDAGIAVEEVVEVRPEVRRYRDELSATEKRENRLDVQIEQLSAQQEREENERDEVKTMRDARQSELTALLADAHVESVDDYAALLDDRDQCEREQSTAETVLTRRLGKPDASDPEEKAQIWSADLGRWRSKLEESDIESNRYDEDRFNRLEAERDELAETLESIEADLASFRDRLAEYERRATGLTQPPGIEAMPALRAQSCEGLADLVDQLDEFVGEIERNADVSRKAITILDAMNETEEEKVTALFAPNGLASQIFAHLTDGRYEAVSYDAGENRFEVHRSDGANLPPQALSRATRDQLYFAARISLAQQVLGGTPGFLLLDDPFLAADRERIHRGFETLAKLADGGWQILYLTAKDEISEGMGQTFDCPVHRLRTIEY